MIDCLHHHGGGETFWGQRQSARKGFKNDTKQAEPIELECLRVLVPHFSGKAPLERISATEIKTELRSSSPLTAGNDTHREKRPD